ncbi:double-strand break repair helicase AddA [Terrihabitans sp. B22-R8]|uniref:double-strand break repair helicase AddA n=1 Tax=Terrihabitans sp. B22-R8 TaxID=3425128 RepID=UPI00403CCBFD
MTLHASDETKARQLRASDPGVSAWVSANAGSGKTTVLSNRVIRLLLAGVEPSRILCLTFTKAAAANMSNRVFGRLAKWAVLPNPDLDTELGNLGAGTGATNRRRARRLFARALETPGGLKVLTIHAFCERVLHQFPFEAGIPASFTVLDDRGRDELVAAARAEVLALAAGEANGPIGRALAKLVAETSDFSMSRALGEILTRGEHLDALMHAPDGTDASARIAERMAAAFDLRPGDSVEGINAEIVDEQDMLATWPMLTEWLRSGTTKDQNLADCLDRSRAAADLSDRHSAYMGVCFTGKMAPRADPFVTKKLREARPDLYQLLLDEQARLVALLERRKAAATCERSIAILTIADAVWRGYRAEKARRGALDFADLITHTRALMRAPGSAWVHYKLDQGIDHILVDEAQDTSPEQWEIVSGLAAEFTAGEGARTQARTIFAVGDEKQSIFSFQGAAPAEFDRWRRVYTSQHEAVRQPFYHLQLTQSFRSTSDVLGAVDQTFTDPLAHAGLSSANEPTVHDTARLDTPGRVELWPLIEPAEKTEDDKPWNAPLDAMAETSPVVQLARRIARAVRGWTRGEDVLGPCPPVPEGEILILVRSRGPLFEAILRELKNAEVRVAGADRLELGGHIAVQDCLALADAILQPADDLALAGVLKSPLFGFDDDDLMRLAPTRRGSLRGALRRSDDSRFHAAEERLARWTSEARGQRPFDFYAGLLGHGGGRRAFRARLGGEVDDVLDEFLQLAMAYGESETATLSGFAAWMRAAPAMIKRDLDTAGSEVRVMTVHGAKGLEAGLVVLADFGCPRAPGMAPVVYEINDPGRTANEPPLLAWAMRKDDDPPALAAARALEKAADEGEHRRLLYVAMTRAADRLVIAGHVGQRTSREGAWYSLILNGFEGPDAAEITRHNVPAFGGDILVRGAIGLAPGAAHPAPSIAQTALPAWLAAPAPVETAAPRPLAPSRALPHIHTESTESFAVPALERGNLLHLLLEELPGLPESDRAPAAHAFLARTAALWPQPDRAALADEALALLADPQFADLLGPAARAEAPVAGEILRADGTALLVAGRIDRLLVTEERVLIVDFKSERAVPSEAPDSYVAQLALYRAVLARIFPGRIIEAAILWTAARRLDSIPEARLDAMLRRVLAMPALP